MVCAERVLRLLEGGGPVVSPSMRWKAVTLEEYGRVYGASVRDVEGFWAREALRLRWSRPWARVREGDPPASRWFVGGSLSAYDNVVGRHRGTWVWGRPALIWEGEDYSAEVLTYSDLDGLAERLAGAFRALGVGEGDWVLFYAPPTPQVIAAMLAAARLGAPFEPVFTGFAAGYLAERLAARRPKLLVTADGFYRRGRLVDTLAQARRALELYGRRCTLVVVERAGSASLREGEVPLDDLLGMGERLPGSFEAPSEHPLFGLSPGYEDGFKPVAHSTGGYLVQVYATSRWMGLRPRDTYFCTVWPGWITGVSYVVFGPLMVGSTVVVYEGGPDYPGWDRWWEIIEAYAVTLFLTTGGALRLLSKRAPSSPLSRNMDTLKAILVTAEPLEAGVWDWAYRFVGTGSTPVVDSVPPRMTGRIPVVNMYIQSELGTFVTGNLVNFTFPPLLPGSVGPPIPGFLLDVVDEEGRPVRGAVGELVVRSPWPAMPVEYPEEYARAWSQGFYRTGDYALMAEGGYVYALGRRDAVMKVSGYRLSPGAIERAVEAATGRRAVAFGAPDELRFEAPAVVVEGDADEGRVREAVRSWVGPIAVPERVLAVGRLPPLDRGALRRLLKRAAWELGGSLEDAVRLALESAGGS